METREYIRALKSLVADFIRDKQPEDVSYYQEVYDWLDSLPVTSLQQEQPDGLDEAAEGYVQTLCDRADENLRIDTTLQSAFKAGAEWMAWKGVTVKGLQYGGNLGIPDIPEEFYTDKQEEVIVQIRKK